ncbi:Uncharacterised protein [Vibrio cholerae]|uniref:Uncharacterized protein n=1 Tax=Vibrio cholerae TaxID=666 RepID=A0A655QQN1_VIBCL|nr:Uncharacterised protein [Vibrio cholerae]CSC63178.1 Uncharacterised protein [Vibrio cholerae]
MLGNLQSGKHGSARADAGANSFFTRKGASGLFGVSLSYVQHLIDSCSIKNAGEVGLRPTANTRNRAAFRGL